MSDHCRDDFDFKFSDLQSEVFNGWQRQNEIISSLDPKSLPEVQETQPTGRFLGKSDLVQDITTDCSVVASLCAGTARGERGHPKVFGFKLPSISRPLTCTRFSHRSYTLMMTRTCSRLYHLTESTFSNCISTGVIAKLPSTIGYQAPKHHASCTSLTEMIRLCFGRLYSRKPI